VEGNAKLLGSVALPNGVSGGWRVALRIRRTDDKKPVELRGFLKSGGEPISETWSYVLPAE
jgi:glucans biosynthesis protein